MNISSILKQYGLSEHETAVYLCLLKAVEMTAFKVAKETHIPRATVYRVLDSLKNTNLVSSWKKNNVAYFTAESPNRLTKILDEKKELISSILPEILNIRKTDGLVPKARIYVGVPGMQIVWDDILDTAEAQGIKRIYAVATPEILAFLPKYFPKWLKRREKLGVFSQLITTDEKSRNFSIENNLFRETRILPASSPIKGTIDIYGDKIAFFSLKNNEIYSVILESPTIAEMLRQFFLSTWDLLEPR